MHLSHYLIALRYAVAIALAIYLDGQVKKPHRFTGRFFAWLMNGSQAPLRRTGRSSILRFLKALWRWTWAAAAACAHNKSLIAEGRVFVEQASISHLPFPDDRFDIVTAIETRYYWPDLPGDTKEILRVLKPGGRMMIRGRIVQGRA